MLCAIYHDIYTYAIQFLFWRGMSVLNLKTVSVARVAHIWKNDTLGKSG